MDPARQRVIAAKGGRSAHALGRAHRFTHPEAVRAGRIGGGSNRKNRPALRCAA
jgi:uncharacterized protein